MSTTKPFTSVLSFFLHPLPRGERVGVRGIIESKTKKGKGTKLIISLPPVTQYSHFLLLNTLCVLFIAFENFFKCRVVNGEPNKIAFDLKS